MSALKFIYSKLLAEYEWIASFHSAASGEKEQIMLPLS